MSIFACRRGVSIYIYICIYKFIFIYVYIYTYIDRYTHVLVTYDMRACMQIVIDTHTRSHAALLGRPPLNNSGLLAVLLWV